MKAGQVRWRDSTFGTGHRLLRGGRLFPARRKKSSGKWASRYRRPICKRRRLPLPPATRWATFIPSFHERMAEMRNGAADLTDRGAIEPSRAMMAAVTHQSRPVGQAVLPMKPGASSPRPSPPQSGGEGVRKDRRGGSGVQWARLLFRRNLCPPHDGSVTLLPLSKSDGGQWTARPTFPGPAIGA